MHHSSHTTYRYNKRTSFIRPYVLPLYAIPVLITVNHYLSLLPIALSIFMFLLTVWSSTVNLLFNYTVCKHGMYMWYDGSIVRLHKYTNDTGNKDDDNNSKDSDTDTDNRSKDTDNNRNSNKDGNNNSNTTNTTSTSTTNTITYFYHNHRVHTLVNDSITTLKADIRRPVQAYRDMLPFNLPPIIPPNVLRIDIPSYAQLMYEHFTAPFFVFQIFCGVLWCLDEYVYYSLFTLFMLFVFETGVVVSRRITMKHYRSMQQKECMVTRIDSGTRTASVVSSTALVPGDVVRIDRPCSVPADMVLLRGACAVNEAMLTGESLPNHKEDVSEYVGVFEREKKHVLFAGTDIVRIESGSTTNSNRDSNSNVSNRDRDGNSNVSNKDKDNSNVSTNIYSNSTNIYSNVYSSTVSGSKDGALIAMVIETGFGTQQGKLIRKMISSAPPDNSEAYLFLLFLLVFAIVSSVIVVYQSIRMNKTAYKILLEVILILTNVVPPELPLELTVAVNAAVHKLLSTGVFCLEPYRIVRAGMVDIACFDKTGTLTENEMVVERVVTDDQDGMISVISTCHTLMTSTADGTGGVVGDPLEMCAVKYVKSEVVSDSRTVNGSTTYDVKRRFYFSSALRRMTVVYRESRNKKRRSFKVAMKGAPETVRQFLSNVPADYDRYKEYASEGYRVLALAKKDMSTDRMDRQSVECMLTFVGFILFRSKIKDESKEVVDMLRNAGCRVVMITGDNAFTAVAVAKRLGIYNGNVMEGDAIDKALDRHAECTDKHTDVSTNISKDVSTDKHTDISKDMNIRTDKDVNVSKDVSRDVSRDMNGIGTVIEPMTDLESTDHYTDMAYTDVCDVLDVSVFARADPRHKERIIKYYKKRGMVTLMCGDGTNDVGALNEADVGVALLMKKSIGGKRKNESIKDALISELIDNKIELGDACVAAPFTIRNGMLSGVLSVIRQGRSTLVTTFQMYKILALNSLITAYSLSFLDSLGVRFNDYQVTISGILIALSFMFLTKCEPLDSISRERPVIGIFNAYFMSSILLQTAVHIISTSVVVWYVGVPATYNEQFVPTILNSSLFVLTMSQQVSTFIVNYIGRPFRESFMENTHLRNSLLACLSFCVAVLFEMNVEMNKALEIVELRDVRTVLFMVMLMDWCMCYAMEWLCSRYLKR